MSKEDLKTVAILAKKAKRLEQINAELLEALKKALFMIDRVHPAAHCPYRLKTQWLKDRAELEQAIKKAEGRA